MSHDTSGYINVDDNADGSALYYESAGAGQPVILSHAGFVDSRMWDEQWRRFTQDYSQDYHIVRYDMRGFGKSDAADSPVNRRTDLHRLLAHLNIERAVLIGCSMSGEIVLDFALEHPEMVAALVLVATAPSGFEMQGEPPEHLMEMVAAMQQGDIETASDLQNRMWVAGPFRQPEEVDAQVWQRAAEMNRIALRNQTYFKMDAAAQYQLDPPAVQRLDEVAAPTLIIAGALDHPEILRAADVMGRSVSGARMEIMADCAHLPNMEQPEKFNEIVLNFLQQRVEW